MKYGKRLLVLILMLSLSACGQPSAAVTSVTDDVERMSELSETVFFGAYPQYTEDVEPMEWITLENQEDRILLLAKDCIESRPWHNTREGVTWDNCDLRAWLNHEFLQTAFTAEE